MYYSINNKIIINHEIKGINIKIYIKNNKKIYIHNLKMI